MLRFIQRRTKMGSVLKRNLCHSTTTNAGPKTQVNHAANVQNRSCSCHCPLSIFRAEERKKTKNRSTEGAGSKRRGRGPKRRGRTVPDDKSSLASCLSVATKEKLKNKSHRQQHKQRTADDAANSTKCVSARYSKSDAPIAANKSGRLNWPKG